MRWSWIDEAAARVAAAGRKRSLAQQGSVCLDGVPTTIKDDAREWAGRLRVIRMPLTKRRRRRAPVARTAALAGMIVFGKSTTPNSAEGMTDSLQGTTRDLWNPGAGTPGGSRWGGALGAHGGGHQTCSNHGTTGRLDPHSRGVYPGWSAPEAIFRAAFRTSRR